MNKLHQLPRINLATTRTTRAIFIAISASTAIAVPAFATIDNTATVSGSGPSGGVNDVSNTVNVPVAPLGRDLDISKAVFTVASTSAGTNATATDGGDTIVYRFTVTNSGNTSESNIVINENTPTFDGNAGTGSFTSGPTEVAGGTGSAATLAPGETVIFEVTYTLSDEDAFRGAGAVDPTASVVNTATADSDDYTMPGGDEDTAITGIVPVASLAVVKSFVLDDTNGTVANAAEVGETIDYTYTVTNTGNVPVTGVSIADTHEGALIVATIGNETIITEGPVQNSDIGTPDDGTIDTLEAGAVATFLYVHTVNQTEFDAQ
jgi:uncharacterized repeat protein (TIGR01451 family)